MLSSWGVAFTAVDLEAVPGARRDLERLGITVVPAVVAGERGVQGWNPEGVAELVGVDYTVGSRLTPRELATRLDRILASAQCAIQQVPPDQLDGTAVPGRGRSVRQLGYHVFRLSLAFRDAMESRRLPEAWLVEEAPPSLADGAALAGYGQIVREQLREWWSRADACEGRVETYYGVPTAHELLERTVWHAAQHVRQLCHRLELLGLAPELPLTEADLRGLPVPKDIW